VIVLILSMGSSFLHNIWFNLIFSSVVCQIENFNIFGILWWDNFPFPLSVPPTIHPSGPSVRPSLPRYHPPPETIKHYSTIQSMHLLYFLKFLLHIQRVSWFFNYSPTKQIQPTGIEIIRLFKSRKYTAIYWPTTCEVTISWHSPTNTLWCKKSR